MGQTARVLKNVIIHQQGQLPVVADLRALPAPGDANLVCTNMRTTDGKRPTFVDQIESWFVIPMQTVRFLEVPKESMAEAGEMTQALSLIHIYEPTRHLRISVGECGL
jgi:hypothetical protein